MKTKTSATRGIVLAALFLALAFVLPMITGHVPQVGNMLCPMHFPILLCGFVLGGPWGLAVGFVAPLLRSVLFGMPPMFPVAISWPGAPVPASRSQHSCPARSLPPCPASLPSSF